MDDGWSDDLFERPTVIPPEPPRADGSLPQPKASTATAQRAPTAEMPAVAVPAAAITRSRARPSGSNDAFCTPHIEVGEPELELIMEGEEGDERSGEQLLGGWLAGPDRPLDEEPGFDDTLDRATPTPSGLLLDDRMVELFSSGAFEGALAAAMEILRMNPGAEVAQEYADWSRAEIRAALVIRLGSIHHIPRLAVALHAIPRSTLDHRTGFLLSRVDGWSTLEDVLDISGMDAIDALRILSNLLDDGIIAMHAR